MKIIDFQPVKRCPKCQHLIPEIACYCPYCGEKLADDSDEQDENASQEENETSESND